MEKGDTIFVVFLTVFVAVSVVDATVLSFTAQRSTVRQRDQIVLTCVYTASFQESQHLTKYVQNETYRMDPEQQDSLGTRFSITQSQNNDGSVSEILTISDATSGDSGNYSCSTYNSGTKTGNYSFVIISVEDEPNTIKLYLNDKEVNGTTELLVPRKGQRLRCDTTGSNPGANITISYMAAQTTVQLNITNTTYSNASYRFDLRDPQYAFLVPVERNTSAFVNNWVFDSDAFQTQVTCTARVNKDAPGISVFFIPNIAAGSPLFACNDSVYSPDGQKNFMISCLVYANPPLTSASFTFTAGGMDYSINGFPVGSTQYSNDRKYSGVVQKVDQIKYSMTLTIVTVDLKANVIFSFNAQNPGFASAIHAVRITGQPLTTGSPVSSTASLFTLFCVLVMTSLFTEHLV